MSCDPCQDCETILFEPTVTLKFINQDSIQLIQDSLGVIGRLDSSLAATLDSLEVLRDSLMIIEDSIANGGSLTQEKANLEMSIAGNLIDSSLFATRLLGSDSIIPLFNQTISTINSGLLQVDNIALLGTGNDLTFDDVDSATIWSIPLSYEKAFTRYEVTIDGTTEIIEFDYDIYEEVDIRRNVLIRAENIRVVNQPYDSVINNCEETCIDGEASFTFYF